MTRRDLVHAAIASLASPVVRAAPARKSQHALERDSIDTVLRSAIERGEIPGVVAMVASPEQILYSGAFGKRDVAQGVAMTEDTIFTIASMTKPVTSVAAMQLVEQRKVTLDEPIRKFLPAAGDAQILTGFRDGKPELQPPSKAITLRMLLTHTAGYAYPMWDENLKEYQEHHRPKDMPTESGPLVFEPGSKWEYGVNVDVAGKLVEAISGLSLEEYFRRNIFEPLEMRETSYNLPAAEAARLTSRHHRQPAGSLTEDPRKAPEPVTKFNGGGGLYSTAGDYVKFTQVILRSGAGPKGRILRAKTVTAMTSNQTGTIVAGRLQTSMPAVTNDVDFHPGFDDRFGFGFLINPVAYTGGRSRGSLAWAGISNTYFWIDPERKLSAVILMQLLPFCDTQAIALLRNFEHAVYSAV